MPRSRLSINNQLFIEKSYIPTYTQSFNLNSKLKDLKKDYDQLQNTLQEISAVQKRIPSRKNSQAKNIMLDDRQNDIMKHSEMNYIFNNKMKEDKTWDIPETTIRKMPELMSQNQQAKRDFPYLKKIKHSYHEKNREQKVNSNSGNKKGQIKNQYDAALSRRQQAKQKIQQRRTKLAQLLRYS